MLNGPSRKTREEANPTLESRAKPPAAVPKNIILTFPHYLITYLCFITEEEKEESHLLNSPVHISIAQVCRRGYWPQLVSSAAPKTRKAKKNNQEALSSHLGSEIFS